MLNKAAYLRKLESIKKRKKGDWENLKLEEDAYLS